MNTPKAADDAMKLLDAGHIIVMRKCAMGSYYAVCASQGTEAAQLISDALEKAIGWDGIDGDEHEREFGDCMPGVTETDDFTPSQVLYRLTEKATTGEIA